MSICVNGPDGDTLATLVNGRMRLHSGTVAQARDYFASLPEHRSDAGTISRERLLLYIDDNRCDAPYTEAQWRAHLVSMGRLGGGP